MNNIENEGKRIILLYPENGSKVSFANESVENFLLALGVTSEEIAAIRRILTE